MFSKIRNNPKLNDAINKAKRIELRQALPVVATGADLLGLRQIAMPAIQVATMVDRVKNQRSRNTTGELKSTWTYIDKDGYLVTRYD